MGSRCCGWAYASQGNYRLMCLMAAALLTALLLTAFKRRQSRVLCLILVYAAPILVTGFAFVVETVSDRSG
jgi:hypothetical protein